MLGQNLLQLCVMVFDLDGFPGLPSPYF
jgi:hypothetical protein